MWRRSVLGLTVVTVLLAGCSALSGRDQSDKSFTAPPTLPSSSSDTTVINARFSSEGLAQGILRDTARDLVAVYTLDYRRLSSNRTAGLAATTGSYQQKYRDLLSMSGRATLRQVRQLQQPSVTAVGLSGTSDRNRAATAFAVIKVTMQSTGATEPTVRTARAAVSLRLVGGRWRISKLSENALPTGTVPANADLARAERAVRSNLLVYSTLSRKNFDAQYSAALKVQTGVLLQQSINARASVLQTLKTQQYDASATVGGLSVIKAGGQSVQFLANVQQYHRTNNGTRFGPYPYTLEVTAAYVNGRWLLSGSETL